MNMLTASVILLCISIAILVYTLRCMKALTIFKWHALKDISRARHSALEEIDAAYTRVQGEASAGIEMLAAERLDMETGRKQLLNEVAKIALARRRIK